MRNLLLLLIMLISVSMYSQEVVLMDTISVNGIRADVKTPVSQKTITAADIQRVYHGQELPILLNTTPSITSNTDGGHVQGYTYFRLRGIDQTRINMTLNGVPLNEPEDQGVYFSNYPNFAKNIQSLQIQRGVGTSSNGVSSFGGSINFISKFGRKNKTEVELEYGSFNTKRFNFTHSTGLSKNGRVSAYVNLTDFETDGYKYHSGNDGRSAFIGGAYYGDTYTLKFTGFTGNSHNQMSWLPVSEIDIADDPRTNYNHENADDNFSQTLAMLEYKKRFNSENTLSTTVFYNRLDGEWDLYVGDMLNFGLGSNFYGMVGNYNYTPENYDINLGISTNRYDRNHTMSFPLENLDLDFKWYDNTGFKNEYSGYLKVKRDIDILTVYGDLQYRYVTFKYDGDVEMEAQDWSFLNPKVGLMFNLNKETNFYASLGLSHREPTRSDMFGSYDRDENGKILSYIKGGGLNSGADNLEGLIPVIPERVIDYEVGINQKMKDFTLQGNFYYMDFKNEITLLGSLGSYGLQQFGNVEQSYRMGLELDVAYNLNKNVTLKYNGNLSENKITDQGISFEPLYTPTAIQNLSINLHKNGIFLELSGKHHNESYLDFSNENITPSFVITNALIGIETDSYGFKVSVLNVFNTEYFTNGYMVGGVRHFYVNAPTSAYGTLTYKF